MSCLISTQRKFRNLNHLIKIFILLLRKSIRPCKEIETAAIIRL